MSSNSSSTDPSITNVSLDLVPLVQAAQIAPADILIARKAGYHLEVLRAICRAPGKRSHLAHLLHALRCLAYTADPNGLLIVLEELGGSLDTFVFAIISADKYPGIHGVLPTLVANQAQVPTVSEIQSRITDPTLIAQWKRFCAGRTFRLQPSRV